MAATARLALAVVVAAAERQAVQADAAGTVS
jgi:hypothetical protein